MQRFTISLDDDLANEFDRLIAQRGVRHGNLNLVSVEAEQGSHTHGYTVPWRDAPKGKRGAAQLHLKPKS